MTPSVQYMYRARQARSSSSSAFSSRADSNLQRRHSVGFRENSSKNNSSSWRSRNSGSSIASANNTDPIRSRAHYRLPFADRRRIIYVLANADANSNIRTSRRYRMLSSESMVMEPSYETVGRQRHLMESRGALNIPPISAVICCLHLIFYLYREKLFNIRNEEDVHVSYDLVWVERQYWRLFLAQFFHFNRLNLIINSVTLFTIGRYLERKIGKTAMVSLILTMSCLVHIIHTFINPWFCIAPKNEFSIGFGNVIYSLRVLLAYALEPRNYERDLVYGLYPMVVSASHAPWQPILDLLIFKLVLPEQCVTGQISGVAAGFIVSIFLLLWPTKGIYIANPPYYWTKNGTTDRSEEPDSSRSSNRWKMRHHTNDDFWLPTSSNTMGALSDHESETTINDVNLGATCDDTSVYPPVNSMQQRSEELKNALLDFMVSPANSVVNLAKRLIKSEIEIEEDERRKQFREKMIRSSVLKTNIKRRPKSEKNLPRMNAMPEVPSLQKPRRICRPSARSSIAASTLPSVQEIPREPDMDHDQLPLSSGAQPPHQSQYLQQGNEARKRSPKQIPVTLYHMNAVNGCGDENNSILTGEIH